MDLTAYFDKALTYDDYVKLLADNRDLHQLHYKKFIVSPEEEQVIKRIKPLKIILLTEPWCGDSLAIFPVVRRMAEINSHWQLRVLRRDENPELMDQFLTRNARAVPIFLFLDENNSLIFRFGPRPQAAQTIFETYREEFKAGKIEKTEVIKKIRNFYAKDRGKAILNELLAIFKENHLL
ncbi:MAG: thioredoxin family protein [Candidatus Aminicenantes bacterium]|jgi:hypothetical protein